jgi:putative dimethyl sulfoxide reductase chaperone
MTTAPQTAPVTSDVAVLDLLLQLIAGTYRSPSAALRDDLASGALPEAYAALAEALDLDGPDVGAPEWGTLQAAYVDLFVSSGDGIAAPPYVGYAIDDELMGPSAQLLGAAFSDHGIELQDAWRDLPDHLAAVAEGGALLVRSDRPEAAQTLLAGYLAPWFERYATAIDTKDVSGFYGPVTKFLQAAIKEVTREARS